MKIRTANQSKASVLLVSLVVAGIIGFSIATYLTFASNQDKAVARAQTWNAAMPVAEAGVEEALSQLRYAGITNLSINSWTADGAGNYHKSHTLPDGSDYSVMIQPLVMPVICSTGYTTFPAISARIGRVVQVIATNAPLFSPGFVAKGDVIMNGNYVKSDSYDSKAGPYDPLTAGIHGNVASQGGLISVGNAEINGSLYLGPNANNSVGPNGQVTGSIYNDFNMDFEDIQEPFTSGGVPPMSGTINGTNYDYVLNGLNGGEYELSSLKGTVYVTGGNNILYVTGDATFDTLIVAPGASVQIYVAGAKTVFGQVNNSGRPLDLQYYGLPSNTSITVSGNGQFVGTIYAPNATLSVNGGGSDTLDFMGGIVVNAIDSLNGHVNLHFDQSLEEDGPKRYVVTSWHEMPI